MASILKVDKIGKTSGSTQDTMGGLAKGWVNFNGTGTIAARGSFNHSSLTDNTTGDYTSGITNGVDSTNNIVFTGSCQDDDDNNKHVAGLSPVRISGGTPFTTTSVRLTTGHDANTTTLRDMDFITIAIHGDLA